MRLHPKRYVLRFIIWSLIILAPVVVYYFFSLINTNYQDLYSYSIHFYLILSNIILITAVITLPYLFINNIVTNVYSWVLIILLCLPSFLDLLHLLLYGSIPSTASYVAIFNTNSSEAFEFVQAFSTWHVLIGIIIITTLIVLIYQLIKRIKTKVLLIIISTFFILNFINIIWRPHLVYLQEISLYRIVTTFIDYKNEVAEFNNFNPKIQNLEIERRGAPGKETHIIIIGESTSRHHMSLYGYYRLTNPGLESLRDELIIYKNVKSSAVTTIESLRDVFLLRDNHNKSTAYTMIDIFNRIGFRTYWISNQQYMEKGYHLVSAIANRADTKIFVNNLNQSAFDDAIIPYLQKTFDDSVTKKVIFIHLMGCHTHYKNRYPAAFDFFSKKPYTEYGEKAETIINAYDNAIRYNDYVVTEIIRRAGKINGSVSLIYFSDHGEEVYDYRDFYGHADASLSKSKFMVDIPFILWVNNEFINTNELLLNRIKTSDAYTLKNFTYGLLDFLGIKISPSGYSSKNKYLP